MGKDGVCGFQQIPLAMERQTRSTYYFPMDGMISICRFHRCHHRSHHRRRRRSFWRHICRCSTGTCWDPSGTLSNLMGRHDQHGIRARWTRFRAFGAAGTRSFQPPSTAASPITRTHTHYHHITVRSLSIQDHQPSDQVSRVNSGTGC